MDHEKLIELVKEYTFIYDLNDNKYSDNQKKDAAWKEIAKKLKVHAKDCKKTWGLLRDSFRRAIKKQKEAKGGQGLNRSLKKWKYQNEMSFLVPHLKERSTFSITTTQDDDEDDHDASVHSEISIPLPDHQLDEAPSDRSSLNIPVKSTTTTKRQRRILHKKSTSQDSSCTALMKYILDSKKNTDDIEQFFAGIVTTVKSFPLREKAIAKAKVFEVISKMEIEILSNPSTSSGNQSPVSRQSSYGTFSPKKEKDYF